MVDRRSQYLRNQAINQANTVRENRAIADRNNDLQYAMSRSPDFYQNRDNLRSIKGILERTPAVTTDQNESRNMYQMLMNQIKGGDKGARLIDTRGLPAGAYRTGRTLFTDPAKSQGFLRDVGSLFTGKNQAAVRAPEYNPFPKAGFGKKFYEDEFGGFDFSGLMEGIFKNVPYTGAASKIASALGGNRDRIPLDRDPDFLPENNLFPIEYDKIEPYVEEEPITFLPQEEYEGSGMKTNPYYTYVGASADAPNIPDITSDIVGDGDDVTNDILDLPDTGTGFVPQYDVADIGSKNYSVFLDNNINFIQNPELRENAKNAALAFTMANRGDNFGMAGSDTSLEALYDAYLEAIRLGQEGNLAKGEFEVTD